jgi:hypothetical protein
MSREGFINIFHKSCEYIPHLSIFAALLVMSLLIFIARYDLLLKASVVLIPLVLISIVLIRKKTEVQATDFTREIILLDTGLRSGTLCKLYTILFISAIIWDLYSQSFDLPILIFVVLLYGVTIFQIFSRPKTSTKVILLELIATSILFEVSQIFSYPFSWPSIDILPHIQWATALINNGGLLPSDIIGDYTAFQLYHISLAVTAQITGLSVYVSSYLITIPMLIISCVFIYSIATYFTESEKIGQISALLYMFIPAVLFRSVCIQAQVPANMAYFLFLYLLFRKDSAHPIVIWVIGGITIVYMTLVHHMTMPLAFLITTILIVSYWLYNKQIEREKIGLIIIFYAIPTIYWIYTYIQTLIGYVNFRFLSPVESGDVTNIVSITTSVNFSYIFHTIISALMLILLYFCIYHLISKQHRNTKYIILLPCIIVFLVLFLPNIVDISSMMSNMLLVMRWRIILAPLFAVALGIGCVVMGNILYQQFHSKKVAASLLIIFCMVMVIASPILCNASDNTAFVGTDLESRLHFTESDLSMYNAIGTYIPNGLDLYSDQRTSVYFSNNPSVETLGLSYYSRPIGMSLLFEDIINTDRYPYIIYKRELYESGNLVVVYTVGDGMQTTILPSENTENTFMSNVYSHSQMYENGDSSIYCFIY